MKNLFVKLVSIVFLFGNIFLLDVQAQTKTCDLQLEVFQFPKVGNNENIKVDSVKAVLTRLDNYKRINSDESGGLLHFSGLEEFPSELSQATYRLTIKKDGYKITYKSFRLDCSKASPKNSVSKMVFLFEGSSKEKVHLIDDGELKPIAEIGRIGEEDLALKLVQPSYYPPAAKAVHAGGTVLIVVGIDEQGTVAAAQAVQGNPLLMAAAVEAAKKSRFVPTMIGDKPAKVKAIVVYNFAAQ